MTEETQQNINDLMSQFREAKSYNSDSSRVQALNNFIQDTESSKDIPDDIKKRFVANAQRDIESIAFRHADIDLIP